MRRLIPLLVAVALLIGAWLATRDGNQPVGPHGGGWRSGLELPGPEGNKASLVRAAQQFLKYRPTEYDYPEGIELLRRVVDGLSDDEWPGVQTAVFAGWSSLDRTPGTRESLQDLSDTVFRRFALFGSPAELGEMIAWSNSGSIWKSRLDSALARVGSAEIVAGQYEGSRLHVLLTASIELGDFARAGLYAGSARLSDNCPEASWKPVRRLEAALRNHFAAEQDRAEFPVIVREWSEAAGDSLSRRVLVNLALRVARRAQYKLDFANLRAAMNSTEPGTKEYWGEVLRGFDRLIPAKGPWEDASAADGLVTAYAERFGLPGIVADFWVRVADRNKEKSVEDALWRVQCLRRAALACTADEPRLALLRRVADDSLAFGSPDIALQNIEACSSRMTTEAGRAGLRAIIERVQLARSEWLKAQEKKDLDQSEKVARLRMESLRAALAGAKARNEAPEVIATLQRRIADLEKRLPE